MVQLEPELGCRYEDIRQAAQAAESAGLGGLFLADHVMNPSNAASAGLGGPVDAWSVIAALARDTSRLRLGTLVSPYTFRLPGMLAVAVAVADDISGGRVELGLGPGHFQGEHKAYGIPFPPMAERFEQLDEYLAVVTGIWDTPEGSTFDFPGRFYQLEKCPGLPKPVQSPHPPIVIGGRGPKKTPRLAAKYATELNVSFQSPELTRDAFERARDACRAAGRDPDTLSLSVTQLVACGRGDDLTARRTALDNDMGKIMAYRAWEDLLEFAPIGTPEEVVERLERYAAIGARRLFFHFRDMRDLGQLELLGREVAPQLAER
jgi:F420-dependent oxidoreductase-like protein